MLTEDGAKFVTEGHYFSIVTKAPRLYWDNDRLEWTPRRDLATVFVLGSGMEEAGLIASKRTCFEVMIEDVTDHVQRRRGVRPGETLARRLRD